MKKGISFFCALAICIGICIFLRQKVTWLSFEEVLNLTDTINLLGTSDGFSNEHPRSIYVDDYINIDNFDQLKSESNCIANISVIERKQKFNIVETTVRVNHVYKGKVEDKIIIYEPICFDGKGNSIAYSSIPLLHKNQKYIVFVKKSLPNDNKHYNYVNSCLGIYPVKDKLKIETFILKDGEDIEFKKIQAFDVIKLDYGELPNEILDNKAIELYYNHINKYEEFHSKVVTQFK